MKKVFHLTYLMTIQMAGRREYHEQTAGWTLSREKAEAHKAERKGNDFCEMPLHVIQAHDLDPCEQSAYYGEA